MVKLTTRRQRISFLKYKVDHRTEARRREKRDITLASILLEPRQTIHTQTNVNSHGLLLAVKYKTVCFPSVILLHR